jgi:hypothetical protein
MPRSSSLSLLYTQHHQTQTHQTSTSRYLTRFCIVLALASTVICQNPTYSIQSVNGYALLRACAQACLWNDLYNLPDKLNCARPVLNACVCRTDLGPSASSFLTTCVNSECSSNSNDLVSAVSLYDSYCIANSYIPAMTTAGTIPLLPTTSRQPPTATSSPTSGPAGSSATSSTEPSELLLMFILVPVILSAFIYLL